ncbi:DNA mismatch repair endonuclease MutL [Acidisoma cellulosilytica]|uniref:DNA mismatch repair protein MutL n=1 Tax=Acidisoma cellulosilyticum TaxID=2802395 RepID=A0A963Z3Z8_9PROT|nr:DNA mismatch repair endonuclease MutL [Acidisoma cellulosilyticum]MCB8882394.1 DNA mismatch repair endonuclease MutL [Acidisoma cellulosilyticum]
MPTIRLLPSHVVDRIAAGEVVERPAAAIKELVENALDAGARHIRVSLQDGGIRRIDVSDDGCGMTAAELPLAIQRHATSKLDEAADLVHITTLGFRGEALPSIGAAARLAITSRPNGADSAHTIRVEGGLVSEVEPAAGQVGTRIIVSDLFFATPARRAFLRSPRVEADHAEAVIRRLALAAPETAFRLEHDGKLILDLPTADRRARLAALLSKDEAETLLVVEAEREEVSLSGFAGAAATHRATGAAQYLVVNGRPVMDPLLKTALRVAYQEVMPRGRFPVAGLWLDLPHRAVDVNVHPAKTELRFRDGERIRGLLISSLRSALSRPANLQYQPRATIRGFGRAVNAYARPDAIPAPAYAGPAYNGPAYDGPAYNDPSYAESDTQTLTEREPIPRPLPNHFAETQLPLAAAPFARSMPAPAQAQAQAETGHPLGAAVAQVLDTYIIAVADDGTLILVDQHAAHERLTHEALREQVIGANGPRPQPLLLSVVVDLPVSDAARLAEAAPDLLQLGLEVEAFGPGAIMVRAMPAVLGTSDPAPLLRDIAEELAETEESTALSQKLDAVIARMACHGSIRAGRRMNAAEMNAMLRQMEQVPRAATCSHGRPTFLKLSRAEIETMFGRRGI